MKAVLLFGVVVFATLFLTVSSECGKCKKCWRHKGCDITENPWTKRSYYVVFVTKVAQNSFWGDGPSCGVFNSCDPDACGCIRMDVGWVKNRRFVGQWVAYDRKTGTQYMRRYYGHTISKKGWAEFTMFISSTVIWVVPPKVVAEVTCDKCGNKVVNTYVIPESAVVVTSTSFKLKAIVISFKLKFRIVVFCSGLRRINNNKPFAVVLATMPQPSEETWEKIRKMLRHHGFNPRKMTFLTHTRCIYAPFDWCVSWVEPKKNPDCDDICKIDK